MTNKIVVLCTCGSAEEAERLARALLDKRLAACVNVLSPVQSFYRWTGMVEKSSEWLLIVKSSRDLFPRLRQALEAAHSYELPEVLALPVLDGSPNYLAWLESELPVHEIRAFILDMDGVIVNSNPVHRLAWEAYNRALGVETTEAMHQRMYGKRNEHIIRDFLGQHLTDAELKAHSDAKETLYRQMIGPSLVEHLVPGVREFLARHRSLPLAVATNANAANTDFVLDETGLRGFFSVVIHGGEVVNPKPHPEIYLKAADLLSVPPASCVVFEDSYTGVEAGLAAGMRVVGVSTTHSDLPGVSLLIRDFNDPALERWITR